LTGDIAAHPDRSIYAGTLHLCAANPQRRKTRLAQIIDARADVDQPVDQIANRAFMHTLDAANAVVAIVQGQRGSQWSDRRAGITHIYIGITHGKSTVRALDTTMRTIAFPDDTQHTQGLQHHAGIVRIEQVLETSLTFG